MNKKEFIERLIDMGGCGAKPGTWSRGWDDAIGEVIRIAEELDEPQKPVVPQFVANEIERYEDMLDMLSGEYFNNSFEEIDDDGLLVWIDENQDTFARAWLDGYEVEKEPLYYVRENNYLLCKYNGEVMDYVEAVERGITDLVKLKLTEKEIKDYDERFWAFAEEVAE